MRKQLPQFILSAMAFIIPMTGRAFSNSELAKLEAFPSLPRVTLSVYGGAYGMAKGDMMVPVYGHDNAVFFVNAQGEYDTSRLHNASFGAGYRQVTSVNAIWGGYTFLDYTKAANGKHFWILSPGVERLGTVWDIRANAYVPVSAQRTLINTAWADELGIPGYTYFVDHKKYSQRFNVYQEMGTGFDLEVGRTVPAIKGLKAYAGLYYYHMKSSVNVTGAQARLEYAISPRVNLVLSDSYDNNRHNTILLGVKLTLGGLAQQNDSPLDIHQRLLDPINRNIGAYSATKQNNQPLPGNDNKLVQDHIYFFDPNGAQFDPALKDKNCTVDHPCANFEQTTVDNINDLVPNATLYFRPGSYNMGNGEPLNLAAGQTMWGRTIDYQFAAQSSDRPILQGSMRLLGQNYLNALRLERFIDTLSSHPGITIANADDITLDNVGIGGNTSDTSYLVGLHLEHAHNITFKNGTVTAIRQNSSNVGILLENSSLNLLNSTITSAIPTESVEFGLNVSGIEASNSQLIIRHSTFDIRGEGLGNGDSPRDTTLITAYGIKAMNSAVDIRESKMQVFAKIDNNSVIAQGINSEAGGSLIALHNDFQVTAETNINQEGPATVAEAWGIYTDASVERNPGIVSTDTLLSANTYHITRIGDVSMGGNVNELIGSAQ